MCHTFSTSLPEIQKPTSACVYPRVTQLCQKAEEKTWGLTQLPDHAQNTCVMWWCCRHHHKTYIQMQDLCLGITVDTIPLHVFFQCPQPAPESQHSQGYKTRICYACILCAPEIAPEFGTFSTLATALKPPSSSSSLCLFSPSSSSLEKLDAFFFFLCVSSASFF